MEYFSVPILIKTHDLIGQKIWSLNDISLDSWQLPTRQHLSLPFSNVRTHFVFRFQSWSKKKERIVCLRP